MLQGIRILDLTWVLGGPFAGQLLAQLGADVIKIEPPEGDPARRYPPYFVDDTSSFFLSVNRGKRSVCLDLKTEAGKADFYELVKKSDAIIYAFRPDVPARLGLDPKSLLAINPRICIGELIGLHDRGEFRKAPAYDLAIQAMSGLMSITGEPGRPPVRVANQISDLAGGLYLALGVAAALVKARAEGEGQVVQLSLLDCQVALLGWQAQNFLVSGEIPAPLGSRHAMLAPSEAFCCADGRYLVVAANGDSFWRKFATVIGRAELAEDPRFASADGRIANVSALSEELAETLALKTADEWSSILFAHGIPAAKVNSIQEALGHPSILARDMVEAVSSPDRSGTVDFLGNPFKYSSNTPLSYPPRLGEHTSAVFGEVCGTADVGAVSAMD